MSDALLRHRGFVGTISYIPEGMQLRGECFGMPDDAPIIVYANTIPELREAFAAAIDCRPDAQTLHPKGMTATEEAEAYRNARLALNLYACDRNLSWFVANQPRLVSLYDGMHIVVQNNQIIATFPDAEAAENWATKHFPDGSCSCFHCIPGIFAYTKID